MERRNFLNACGAVLAGGATAVRAMLKPKPAPNATITICTLCDEGPGDDIELVSEFVPLGGYTHVAVRAGESLDAGQAVVIRGLRAFAARDGETPHGIVDTFGFGVGKGGFASVCVRGTARHITC